MITKCPECSNDVSTHALACPHCGYPLQKISKRRGTRVKKKRRRLPNGFGQITELKNRNLRRPFRAMVTVGKNEKGKPICRLLKPVSYFETYNDAYKALLLYGENPFDLLSNTTMQELYNKWSEEHYKNVSESTIKGSKNAWSYCSMLYNEKVANVRIRHLKRCLERGYTFGPNGRKYPTAVTKVTIKNLLNQLLDYAVENELTDKNYARLFDLPERTSKEIAEKRKSHIRFSEEEMSRLWKNINRKDVDMLLIQCYSGWRPDELCEIKLENINLDDDFIIGGKKTTAGKDRIVPIHSKIKPLVVNRYEKAMSSNGKYLFINSKGNKYSYPLYRRSFNQICQELGLNSEHKPHDCRVEFISNAKKYGVDEYAIKYIVGHSISDLTEKIYTKRDPQWLKEEIEKIK